LLKNLDSLKKQTIKNFEIILIDNNKIDVYPFAMIPIKEIILKNDFPKRGKILI
jgi:glycosyltransferase involved in cell wall biosynthesis